MSIAESFIEYPAFSKTEVAESIGVAKSIRKVGNEFTGSVADWARDRERIFGETIIPRHVYVVGLPRGEEHRVAWVFHEGFSQNSEPFCMHHIACDCSGDVERADTPEEREEIMRNCPGMSRALEAQASAVNNKLMIDEMLRYNLKYHAETPMEEQSEIVQQFVGASLLHLLKIDYEYPRSWIANVESGGILTQLAAKIFSVAVSDIEWVAEDLKYQDEVEFDGQIIALNRRIKDSIDAERQKREKLRGLEAQLAA